MHSLHDVIYRLSVSLMAMHLSLLYVQSSFLTEVLGLLPRIERLPKREALPCFETNSFNCRLQENISTIYIVF